MAYLILLNSSFKSDQSGFYNRDQEERSFGLHVATPIELKLFSISPKFVNAKASTKHMQSYFNHELENTLIFRVE